MSNVSRSTYQKVVEENKRLKQDIIVLTDETFSYSLKKIQLVKEWRDKIQKDKELNLLMKEFATQYLKDHPEYDIANSEKFNPLL